MGDTDKTKESGKAGKPGETTATIAAPETATENLNLTAGGITDLLKGEWATATAQGEPGNEAPPETPSAETLEATDETETAPETIAETETGETETGETSEVPGETAETETAEFPPELQAAVESWEDGGKGKLPPVLQVLVDRRINKLYAKHQAEKEEREAKVVELTAELEKARSEAPAQDRQVPALMDDKALGKLESEYNRFVSDTENFLDDTATTEERTRVEKFMETNGVDAAGLKRLLREASRELLKFPEKRKAAQAYKQTEAAAEPEAKKFFPWLDNKASKEYQIAKGVLEAIPDLRSRTPLHRIVLGVYVLGLQQFEKLRTTGKAAVTGKAPLKAPPKVPTAGAAAPAGARAGKATAEDAARVKFEKNPTRESVTELLKAGLR